MKKLQQILFYCLIFFLPTQLGLHFWPSWAYIQGLRIDYFSPTIYFTDILVILILSFWLASRRSGLVQNLSLRPRPGRGKQSILFVSCFLFLAFSNIFFSHLWPVSLYKWLKVGEFTLLGYWVAKNITNRLYLVSCSLLSCSVLFQSFLVFSQYFHQGSLGGLFYFFGERFYTIATPGIARAVIAGQEFLRPYGTFSHPNVLAGFLVVIYPLILNYLKKCYDKKGYFLVKIFLVAGSILTPIVVIMTISRLGIFVMTATLLLFSLTHYFPKFTKLNPKIIFFALLICLIFLTANRYPLTATGDIRWQLNAEAIKLFLSYPLFGIGLGTFPQATFSGISFQPAHNIYLLLLSETGFVGFIIFIVFIYLSLLTANPYLLTPILFLGLFDHYFLTLQQTQLLFAIILGLSWSKIKP